MIYPALLTAGAAQGEAVEDLHPGDPRLIGSYRLLKRVGGGGMGRVFLGQSPGGRLVAVKVIRSELAADPGFRGRFAQEVAAARRVSGAFTAPVIDADPDAAEPWLVTSYVDGPSLADAIAVNGPMTAMATLALARALAEGLAAIHAAGVVHRDLKPSNVLLAADGPRIIDFGISRAAGATVMTEAGLIVGSPGFMSPEQADGQPVGPASDVFSLGTLLAYAASGDEPFGTGHPQALLYRVVHGSPGLDGVPASLRPVVERCMSKDPAQRPTSRGLLALLVSPASDAPAWSAWWAGLSHGSAPAANPASRPPGYSPTAAAGAPARPPVSNDRPASVPPAASARPATLHMNAGKLPRDIGTAPQRRRRHAVWAAAAAVVVLGCASAGIALAAHDSGARGTAGSASGHDGRTTATAADSPRAVVKAFIAAINEHDWHKVWQLGGKNLGETYGAMVAGFRETNHDVLNRITSHGDTVNARITAYESTGTVQTFALSYTVRAGMITAGRQTLLATRKPAVAQSG